MTGGFRPVALPAGLAGTLFLHGMPGRDEALHDAWQRIGADRIDLIVCLAGLDEIARKSPAYATSLSANTVPCAVRSFAIPDFGVPHDRDAFSSLAHDIAARLTAGERVLIHCGAGIGRTGTLATCVLLALGVPQPEAVRVVTAAGSDPETPAQRELVAWCAARARL